MRDDRDDEAAVARRQDEAVQEAREQELQVWVRKVWSHFGGHGTLMQRLRKAVTLCDMVERRGPNMRRDEELMLNVLLTEWGPARTVKMLAFVAEQEERDAEHAQR